MFYEMNKHIDVRYHFVYEVIACCDVVVSKVDTKDNLIDMLAKLLPIIKFEHWLNLVGVCH